MPPALTFTAANWNTPQTVSVSAVDDATVEGAHRASSSDAFYAGLSIAPVSATIADNDTPPTPIQAPPAPRAPLVGPPTAVAPARFLPPAALPTPDRPAQACHAEPAPARALRAATRLTPLPGADAARLSAGRFGGVGTPPSSR